MPQILKTNQLIMNKYETVFILTPVLSDAQMKEAVEKFTNLLKEQGAEIVNEENWGLRKLAYPIDKKKTGFYVLVTLEMDGTNLVEVERRLNITEEVMRYIIVKKD